MQSVAAVNQPGYPAPPSVGIAKGPTGNVGGKGPTGAPQKAGHSPAKPGILPPPHKTNSAFQVVLKLRYTAPP